MLFRSRLYAESDLGTMLVADAEYKLTGADLEGYKRRDLLHEEGVENISFAYAEKGTYFLSCENRTGKISYVDVPVQMYDNYQAYIDDADRDEISLSYGENCRVRVQLPVDFEGTICLKYEVPFLWRVCEVLSCVTFFGIIVRMKTTKRNEIRESCGPL